MQAGSNRAEPQCYEGLNEPVERAFAFCFLALLDAGPRQAFVDACGFHADCAAAGPVSSRWPDRLRAQYGES
jgi:hypothetical protein